MISVAAQTCQQFPMNEIATAENVKVRRTIINTFARHLGHRFLLDDPAPAVLEK